MNGRASAMLLAALAAVTAACGGTVPSAPPSGAGSSATPPGASGVEGSPAGSSWSRHVLGGDAPDLAAIVPTDDGLLAVGASAAGGGVWRSADGLSWTAVGELERDVALVTLARGDGRYVAAGRETQADGSYRAVVRVSDDGTTWQPATTPPEGAFDLAAVAFAAGRWVAAGSGSGPSGEGRVLWTSQDGLVWRHVAVPDPSRVTALAAGDAGFVAVGEGASGQSGLPSAVVLTSTDGTRWTGIEDPDAFGFTSLQAAAFGNGQYLVGGVELERTGAARPVMWTSTDLTAWQPVTIVDDVLVPGGSDGVPAFAEGAFVGRIGTTPGGWIATGLGTDARDESMAQDVAIWRSTDGVTFRREPHALAFEAGSASSLTYTPTGLAAWDGTVLVSGRSEGMLPTIWLTPARAGGSEPSPRPSPGGPRPTEPCCDATPAPMAP